MDFGNIFRGRAEPPTRGIIYYQYQGKLKGGRLPHLPTQIIRTCTQ